MIQEDDLWIGDKVQLKKSGRIGKYAGKTSQGKYRIAIGNRFVVTSLGNMVILAHEDSAYEGSSNKKITVSKNVQFPDDYIDLHIDKLNPSMEHQNPILIRDYQIATAKKFLAYAKSISLSPITIIHGRGEGILRSEIRHLIEHTDGVYRHESSNNDGATVVWLFP